MQHNSWKWTVGSFPWTPPEMYRKWLNYILLKIGVGIGNTKPEVDLKSAEKDKSDPQEVTLKHKCLLYPFILRIRNYVNWINWRKKKNLWLGGIATVYGRIKLWERKQDIKLKNISMNDDTGLICSVQLIQGFHPPETLILETNPTNTDF